MLTLETLNRCSTDEFVASLEGVYEHSPWVARRTAATRPFASCAALRLALEQTVRSATAAQQLQLIRAHPELAGKEAAAGTLTAESSAEQASAGLGDDDSRELATLRQLNADYRLRFGFPFVVAVRGHDGAGLSRAAILATLQRRLLAPPAAEITESLSEIAHIAALRLRQRCGA